MLSFTDQKKSTFLVYKKVLLKIFQMSQEKTYIGISF